MDSYSRKFVCPDHGVQCYDYCEACLHEVESRKKNDMPSQLASARKLIEDIRIGNHYPEATDLCERWLRENPEIK